MVGVAGVVPVVRVVGLVGPVGPVGTNDSRHGESVLARANNAPNWVTEHLGASSRRPRHPEPSTTKNCFVVEC